LSWSDVVVGIPTVGPPKNRRWGGGGGQPPHRRKNWGRGGRIKRAQQRKIILKKAGPGWELGWLDGREKSGGGGKKEKKGPRQDVEVRESTGQGIFPAGEDEAFTRGQPRLQPGREGGKSGGNMPGRPAPPKPNRHSQGGARKRSTFGARRRICLPALGKTKKPDIVFS